LDWEIEELRPRFQHFDVRVLGLRSGLERLEAVIAETRETLAGDSN
jgi:hypothetical protein